MKLGTETASVLNHLLTAAQQIEPQVGMGATICYWTDRHAATIVKVTATQIHVRQDIATRIDNYGPGDSQQYEYAPNPNAPIQVFRKTKRGYRCNGAGLLIGDRDEHYDYSF